MELVSDTYTIIGKNKQNDLRIKLTLSTIPTLLWTGIFNRYNKHIFSVKNTTAIYLVASPKDIEGVDFVEIIKGYIQKTDAEIVNDNFKKTLLTGMPSGFIIAHDSLNYSLDEGEDKSAFEIYLENLIGWASEL